MSVFHDLITKEIHPKNKNIAIYDSDLKAYSYADLFNEIQKVNEVLQRNSFCKGSKLILKVDKSFKSLAYILSCIQLQIIYIPVDTSTPAERLKNIIQSSKANAILNEDFSLLKLDEKSFYGNENAVCVLYTSGSTGIPKGVVISGNGLYDFTKWNLKEFKIKSDDILTSFAPYHFDLSTLDLFSSLSSGAAVWLINQNLGSNIRLLGDHLKNIQPSIWYATPTVFNLLVQYGKMPIDYCPRLVLFAGEVFPIKNLNALRNKWEKAIYYNLYGPTETNVCTYYKLPNEIENNRVNPYPIGMSCDFSETKISKENELLVSSSTVLLEYMNNITATNNKVEIINNKKWFKTGDRVHIENNQLIYDGRMDRMVKRNGYRIELGEIEATLNLLNNIKSVAVISINNNETVKVIAFYTGQKSTTIELLSYCSNQLLKYMIPDKFIYLEEMPINNNGKIDYNHLITNFNDNE